MKVQTMLKVPGDIAFTPAVKAVQQLKRSRNAYAKMENGTGWQTKVTPDLAEFIAGLDMFYLGTANSDWQPYIQYRGGPKGFLKVMDEHTLGFADFTGNRQYITAGNLSENTKAFIFLMDYLNRRRVKLRGNARVIEGNEDLSRKLADPAYKGKVERAIMFEIAAWDTNCSQHIHQRLPLETVNARIHALQMRIIELEKQLEFENNQLR